MTSSFAGLLAGLALAIVLVYLLIVVNFQSWLDPFIIISALPAALAGIVWMLFLTHTTISVPSLTGRDHVHGRRDRQQHPCGQFCEGRSSRRGSFGWRRGRRDGRVHAFRPVLMTALAMIIGMVPMALGFGEGGEQNAPLGRAVIGGLTLATVATLFFVPAVFALFHRQIERRTLESTVGDSRVSSAGRARARSMRDSKSVRVRDQSVGGVLADACGGRWAGALGHLDARAGARRS